jgi:hypothetical protein
MQLPCQCGRPRPIVDPFNQISMNYALQIHDIQVGPFTTHIAATVFAEQNGHDNYTMIELYDPAEAGGVIAQQLQVEATAQSILDKWRY